MINDEPVDHCGHVDSNREKLPFTFARERRIKAESAVRTEGESGALKR